MRTIFFLLVMLAGTCLAQGWHDDAQDSCQLNKNYVNDINNDGVIIDISMLIDCVLSGGTESNGSYDVDKDGNVNSIDVTSMINIILGRQRPRIALNVLSLGNSYSADAYSYVPYIVNNVAPELELTIAFTQVGGCYLERQYKEFCVQDKPASYILHTPDKATWTVRGNVKLSDVLAERNWDLILLQQASKHLQR